MRFIYQIDLGHCSTSIIALVCRLGAVAENIDLAARELGLRANIEAVPDRTLTDVIFRARFQRDAAIANQPPVV